MHNSLLAISFYEIASCICRLGIINIENIIKTFCHFGKPTKLLQRCNDTPFMLLCHETRTQKKFGGFKPNSLLLKGNKQWNISTPATYITLTWSVRLLAEPALQGIFKFWIIKSPCRKKASTETIFCIVHVCKLFGVLLVGTNALLSKYRRVHFVW